MTPRTRMPWQAKRLTSELYLLYRGQAGRVPIVYFAHSSRVYFWGKVNEKKKRTLICDPPPS